MVTNGLWSTSLEEDDKGMIIGKEVVAKNPDESAAKFPSLVKFMSRLKKIVVIDEPLEDMVQLVYASIRQQRKKEEEEEQQHEGGGGAHRGGGDNKKSRYRDVLSLFGTPSVMRLMNQDPDPYYNKKIQDLMYTDHWISTPKEEEEAAEKDKDKDKDEAPQASREKDDNLKKEMNSLLDKRFNELKEQIDKLSERMIAPTGMGGISMMGAPDDWRMGRQREKEYRRRLHAEKKKRKPCPPRVDPGKQQRDMEDEARRLAKAIFQYNLSKLEEQDFEGFFGRFVDLIEADKKATEKSKKEKMKGGRRTQKNRKRRRNKSLKY